MKVSQGAAITALSILLCSIGVEASAKPARPAPPLPAPTGRVVNVATDSELQAAVRALTSDTTIVIAPGKYVLSRTLYVRGALKNVAIRGASDNADDVVLVGRGMTQTNYGLVPYGIWTGDGVDGITIANLTIREFYFHPIILNGGTQRPHIYNVHLVDAGEQFIKSNPDSAGVGAAQGVLEYSVIEFTGTARNNYPKGIDVHGGTNWIIRHNLFRNIVGPGGSVAGPGVLVWRGSSHTLTEGNTFINCSRGISYGADDKVAPSHRGGIIRNNMIYRSSAQPGDVGIILSASPDTRVLNNTIVLSKTYPRPIEYRYAGTQRVVIANNLVDGAIQARDGATALLVKNLTTAAAPMFVDAASGDLHLASGATAAIDQGDATVGIADDWDGDSRPAGAGIDIGADERSAEPDPASIDITSPGNGAVFALPASVNLAVNVTPGSHEVTRVDYYTDDVWLGGSVVNPFAMTVTDLVAGDHHLTAIATDSAGGTASSPSVSIQVTAPPTVTLTAPSNQAVFVPSSSIQLSATASDPDGTIAHVKFLVNGASVASDSSGPYEFVWSNVPAGTYEVRAIATDDTGVAASSNISWVRVGLPDLVETSVTGPPTVIAPGMSFSASDITKNSGSVPALSSSVRYYLSADQLRNASDIRLTGSRAVSGLEPGAVSTGSKTVTVPDDTTPGTYRLLACADDALRITESSEINNCRPSDATVLVAYPELGLSSLASLTASVAPGGKLTVTDTVQNKGLGPAASSSTRYFLSTDSSYSASDTFIGAHAVSTLAPGAAMDGKKALTVALTTTPGTYYLIGCADGLARVRESDETNNCRVTSTTIVVE